jgi:hypothetical protein
MKHLYLRACLFATAFFLGLSLNAQTPAETLTPPSPLQFDKTTYDFGEIAQGVPQTCSFEVTNTGTEPILIQNVRPSCGCTEPDWTKQPLEPGKKGYIRATYNAVSAGPFSKTLTVTYSGATKPVTLHLKGTVKAAN